MSNLINSISETVKVPLRFHWSVLILPVLLVLSKGILGIPIFIMVFASLLFHEYSHVWAAQKQGLFVPYVITHGLGAAAMINMPDVSNYKQNLKVSIAGPVGSFLLFGFGLILQSIFHSNWIDYFTYINFILGAFNMLPLFPSDGGRILYSIIGMKFGGLRAIRIVVWTSWILCGLGIIYGIISESYWLVLIFVFIIHISIQEKRVTEARLNRYY
jgi:Zn-dependent protease